MDSVSLEIPAKVNLTLEILGRRTDGYHLLRSLVMPVGITDTITVRSKVKGGKVEGKTVAASTFDLRPSTFSCSVIGDGIDCAELVALPPEKQLAVKAATALQKAFPESCHDGVDIAITKRIPIGAGMGGGSADAAGTLIALNRLWGLNLPAERLAEIGATVGSDVAALTLGGAVTMEGTGDIVTKIPLAETTPLPWAVIVFPGFPVSTHAAYAAYDAWRASVLASRPNDTWRASVPASRPNDARGRAPSIYATMEQCLVAGDIAGMAQSLHNDLQETVFAMHPVLREWRDTLLAHGALGALLSGSGSAVFGLVPDRAAALALAQTLRDRSPTTWVTAGVMTDCRLMASGGMNRP
ncbi:MAG: 4-(cytidine 5'-diphospho)-2-C-methyl-D-erythritol kinase, partial [Kiritimatiellaeota bacterium]|nr:4-(cytidine 5'-diphospho)-2-C-methyl-D-erythritol kinase [Kiritimatiellota bacterium]